MATTPTQLPVPSEKPQDLKFNAGKIDEFVTSKGGIYTDRLGTKHYTIEGLNYIAMQAIKTYGYVTIDSFEDGATLTLPNQVLRWKSNGEYYRWDGSLATAKNVPFGSTPQTTGGIGSGAWISVGDAALRQNLSSGEEGMGGYLLGFKKSFPGAQATTVATELDSVSAISPETFRTNSLMSDDALFAAMFSQIDVYASWASGFGVVPDVIDLRGKTYTLTQEQICNKGVNLINGRIELNGGSIILGALGSTSTLTYAFQGLTVVDTGTAESSKALIEIRTCFNVLFCANYMNARKPTSGNRSRYCLFVGSSRGWGIGVVSGYYTGGRCTVRIGKTSDHTGIFVGAGATIDHGSVCNLLLCNPAGATILGSNIEHAENGAAGSIIITSSTNGSVNYAHSVTIQNIYDFNTGKGTSPENPVLSPAAVVVGRDVPGTLGWDVEGQLITSGNTADNIRVCNSYLVSDRQQYAAIMRGRSGLIVENCVVINNNADGDDILFEGTAARSHAKDNRNQNLGTFDKVGYTSSNAPSLGVATGSWNMSLTDSDGVGSYTRSTFGGGYSVVNDLCTAYGHMVISSVVAAATGQLRIPLPVPVRLAYRAGTTIGVFNIAGTKNVNIGGSATTVPTAMFPVIGQVLDGGSYITLYTADGQALPASAITAGTSFQFSISYPVRLANNRS
ncbi:tail fiber/spike domain-containing protein [Rahnella aceris]